MSDPQEQIYAFYTTLVRRNAALIRWLCMRQAGDNKALCDDLVQEALLGLWLHIDSYRRGVPEKVWISWKVRTILYDYRRPLCPAGRLFLEWFAKRCKSIHYRHSPKMGTSGVGVNMLAYTSLH